MTTLTTEPSSLSSPDSTLAPLQPAPAGAGPAGAHAGRAAAARTFDLCHPGLALRAVLFVQGLLVLAAALVAVTWSDALARLGVAVSAGLIGTLAWLVAVCGLQRVLQGMAPRARGLALAGLGAAAALAGWWPLVWVQAAQPLAPRLVAVPLAGAALGALAWGWLEARARSQRPADASARLAELQARIRPHFLFNALNSALALVQVDPRRAEAVLEDLAELFRVVLSDANAAVPLAEEVELARKYLAIEQIRFGDRLRVQWELDPAAGAALVPPLVLQPLLENAVRHGVEPAREGGTIRVRTALRLGQAVVRIDNTVPAAASQPGHGIALANVRERLHLLHDVAAQFDARRDGRRFRVRMVVPA